MKPTYIAIYAKATNCKASDMELFLEMSEFAKNRGSESEFYLEKNNQYNTRPVKFWLLQELRKKKFDGLLVYSYNEWANSLNELVPELYELVKSGIVVYSFTDEIQFTECENDPIFRTLSTLFHFRKHIIDVSRENAIEKYKASGKKLGRPLGAKDKQKRKTLGYFLREDYKKDQGPKSYSRAFPHLIV